jgi:hypothetical protein
VACSNPASSAKPPAAIVSMTPTNRFTAGQGGVSIVYDGDGNRAAKTVAGVKTAYIFDDRNPTGYVQVLAEVQGGAITRSYVYGLELIEQDGWPRLSDDFGWPILAGLVLARVGACFGSCTYGVIRWGICSFVPCC